MKKISTLYKKNPENLGLVINEVNHENEWVFTDDGVKATQKLDGTACAVIEGELYKRYDVKKGKQVPEGAIPCQEPDEITGHWPHWIKCDPSDPSNKYHLEGFNSLMMATNGKRIDGTYELCGEKVQGNPEDVEGHHLFRHGSIPLDINGHFQDMDFEMFKNYLAKENIEVIVFHNPDGRMCKLRKSDYGIKR